MKRFFIIAAVLAVFMPAGVLAQVNSESPAYITLKTNPSDSLSSSAKPAVPLFISPVTISMAAGVSVGLMDGVALNIAAGINEKLAVRAGYGFIPSALIPEYGVDLPTFGSNPATSTALSGSIAGSGNLLVDFHPTGGGFRVTAGLFFGSSDFIKGFNTKALPESYHQAGVTYYSDGAAKDKANRYRIQSDSDGIVTAVFKSAAVKPFVGIGFGHAVPGNRVGVAFDLGVEYTGGLDLRVNALNRKDELENIPITSEGALQTVYEIRGHNREMSYDKYISYIDKLRDLPILPVARFSIFVKLF